MGANQKEAAGSLRISLGWNTAEGDVEKFIGAWTKMAGRIKNSKEFKELSS
jgi:cysteine desulfurase